MNKLDRISWDDYFMTLALVTAQKSIDTSTKHGCVVVHEDKTILSTGYNNPPRGCDDENIPLERPLKYEFFEHAESNAICNASRHGISLNGSIFYISGHPCPSCFRKIINVGASKIIYGPIGSQCVSEKEIEIINKMNLNLKESREQIKIIKYNNGEIIKTLLKTKKYIEHKMENK
jgi:dCMP deaminase